jgi:FKBP-type peptidyl-prolyl cis-trans isomerase
MTSTRFRLSVLLLLPLPLLHGADPAPATGKYPPETYVAVGADFARATHLGELGWTEPQFNAFLEGLRAAFQGKTYPLDHRAQQLQTEIGKRLQEIAEQTQNERLDFSKPGRMQGYIKEISKEFGLRSSDSGLAYALMPGGTGFRPGPDDTVVLTYAVTAADQRTELPQLAKEKFRCKVSELQLPGLVEAVQLLTPGGRGLFVLVPDLTYGTGDWPAGVPRGQPLIYTVTLHEVVHAQ